MQKRREEKAKKSYTEKYEGGNKIGKILDNQGDVGDQGED